MCIYDNFAFLAKRKIVASQTVHNIISSVFLVVVVWGGGVQYGMVQLDAVTWLGLSV